MTRLKLIAPAAIVAVAGLATFGATHAQQAQPTFAEIKQRIIDRLTQEIACVQAATDEQALRACRPHGPMGRGGPGGQPPPAQ